MMRNDTKPGNAGQSKNNSAGVLDKLKTQGSVQAWDAEASRLSEDQLTLDFMTAVLNAGDCDRDDGGRDNSHLRFKEGENRH